MLTWTRENRFDEPTSSTARACPTVNGRFLLRSDDNPLAVVKDSSAQDVFIAKESDRYSANGSESIDGKGAHVHGGENNTAASHLHVSLAVRTTEAKAFALLGHRQRG